MFETLFDFILGSIDMVLPFVEFLITPVQLGSFGSFAPIAFFGIGAFTVIFTLHVAHLINFIAG